MPTRRSRRATYRKWVAAVAVVLPTACSSPSTTQHDSVPSPDEPQPTMPTDTPRPTHHSTKPASSGEVALTFEEVLVHDGGIHGVQGHRLRIPRTGPANWKRSVDSFRPSGTAGSGESVLTSTQLAAIEALAEVAWEAAAEGPVKSFGPIQDGPPRWKWTITIRRGEETRSLEGSAMSPLHDTTPRSALALLRWANEFVDAQASQL